MTGTPTVAAIVVGTNERRWLTSCFESLCASDTDGFTLRVCYVDNASTDGSIDLVGREFPQIQVIGNHANIGFAGANNVGMRRALAAGADYLFLVNPDTCTPASLLAQMVRFMRQWPGYGIIGPLQLRYTPGKPLAAEYNEWTLLALDAGERHVLANDHAALPTHPQPQSPRSPDTLEHAYVQGAALFASARMLREIGLFDDIFHTYYEEVDLCRRARLAGWRVALLTDAVIGHHGGGGTVGSAYRRQHMMRNKYYYLAADIDIPRLVQARIALQWLVRDLRGRGIGGESPVLTGIAETTGTLAWLARHCHAIARRRRLHRALRAR